MILLKNKIITVDAYTSDQDVFSNNHLDLSNSFIPSWWKALPKFQSDPVFPSIEISTMKKCMGMIDLYKLGFIFSSHSALAYDTALNQVRSRINVKLPWVIKEKSGVRFTCLQPTYNYQDLNCLLSLDTTIWSFSSPKEISLDFSITKKFKGDDSEIIIKKNIALAHFIPLIENDIVINKHLVDKKEYELIKNHGR